MSELVNAVVRDIAAAVGGASAKDPDFGITIKTPEGVIDVLPFRRGVTESSRAWRGDADWAALIVYPGQDAGLDAAPEVYVVPGADFSEDAFRDGGLLQHVDYRGHAQPGVLWIDLGGAAYDDRHARLARYRVA
ncbi:hypothetical protein E1293_45920 [Actinomadura darangshiensis]|uniref:Uncharacterized protein n=1 Tax=Actinomadura darangshiensis TaxID=705336 RepID=A0A4R4ZP86_9ACTN|nr:hypothetical protein [Actinomadura darangshiensis]TDD60130.1 hypothetical protein E1293_45920 [Actinomadura darangshiensis]